VEHGKLDGPLTGAQAVVRWPSDKGGWWWLKAYGVGALRCERGGMEDGVEWGGVR
jgi:hypothetical protein